MKTIKINGEEYNYKYSLRSLFIFEKIAGKPFQLSDTLDTFTFFYAMLLANNPDKKVLDFEAFIDACEADMGIMNEMSAYLLEYLNSPINSSNEDEKNEKVGKKK